MAESDRTFELILLGLVAGSVLTYILLEINTQLRLFNQQAMLYNQYSLIQQSPFSQIQQPQITYPSSITQPTIKPQQKRLYTIERDADGFILLPD